MSSHPIDHWFDRLARATAAPHSRRSALRYFTTAVGAAVLHSLASSSASAANGRLPCEPGLELCAGICVDTLSDPGNCGRCGNLVARCSNGQSTTAPPVRIAPLVEPLGPLVTISLTSVTEISAPGICMPSGFVCFDNQACCQSGCTDLTSDNNNCGVCGTACTPDQSCVTGSCCPSAQVCLLLSGPVCCSAGASCSALGCCPSGQAVCGGVCCGPGRSCCGGACCDSGQCSGATCITPPSSGQ